jgi:hypothetical protein
MGMILELVRLAYEPLSYIHHSHCLYGRARNIFTSIVLVFVESFGCKGGKSSLFYGDRESDSVQSDDHSGRLYKFNSPIAVPFPYDRILWLLLVTPCISTHYHTMCPTRIEIGQEQTVEYPL